jgi:hypothetical protein
MGRSKLNRIATAALYLAVAALLEAPTYNNGITGTLTLNDTAKTPIVGYGVNLKDGLATGATANFGVVSGPPNGTWSYANVPDTVAVSTSAGDFKATPAFNVKVGAAGNVIVPPIRLTPLDNDLDGEPDWIERKVLKTLLPDKSGGFYTIAVQDALDALAAKGCANPSPADSDCDGLLDGQEDSNHNGVVDAGETSPLNGDSDGDGILDGVDPQPLVKQTATKQQIPAMPAVFLCGLAVALWAGVWRDRKRARGS